MKRKWSVVATCGAIVVAGIFGYLVAARSYLRHQVQDVPALHDPQFLRSLVPLMGPPLHEGNAVTELLNGDQIFPSMLEAIRGAQKSICFETYIYWSGEIGREFSRALAERARAGVPVHVLVDWLGGKKMDAQSLAEMQSAGVEVEHYHPFRLQTLFSMNNRTHRKLLVIDGKIGFTGGVGIADKWSGHGQSPEHWRDSHFRVEGPAVAEMQATFMDNWVEVRPQIHHDARYFPELLPAGSARAQVIHSAPDGGSLRIRLMYALSVAAARTSLRISNAYFIPDDDAVQQLVDASRRGVRVEIIVPGEITDSQVTRKASKATWGELLRGQVHIYEYQPTMYHCKVMIVDDEWVSVGSTNFDNRSFRLNDEANLNILDGPFARRQAQVFDEDKTRSREVTLTEWEHRGVWERAQERIVDVLGPEL